MYKKLNIKTKLKQKRKKKLKSSSSSTRTLKNTNSDLKHMPRFSSIFLPFLVNQTQKHKHKLVSNKNKNTNTKLAIDLPCQPNTEATNTNPATDNDEDEGVEKLLEPFMKDHLVALIKKGVSKHPDLIEIVRELADVDPAYRKISIHGLSWDTTVETLTSIFGKYGEIAAFWVVHDLTRPKPLHQRSDLDFTPLKCR